MQRELSILPIGSLIPDPEGVSYIVDRLLGKGGFGAVYLVYAQGAEQRLFAMKEYVHPEQHQPDRLTLKGEVLTRLDHPALPRVYRVFAQESSQRTYVLMEYIDGQDLEALQQEQPQGRFPMAVALSLMTPIVDALIYLHRQHPPIVHRDVKPANIIVPRHREGTVLVDFDLAKEYVADRTTDVIRYGTHGYAAPEQYGGGTTPQTDLYSVGATLYTLLTGTVPPDSLIRATRSHELDPLVPAHLIAPTVPAAVAAAIGRAMSISRDDRFETLEQFWQAVTAASQQPTPLLANTQSGRSAHPSDTAVKLTAGLPARKEPQAQKHGVFPLIALPVLVTLLIVAVGFLAYVVSPDAATTHPRVTSSAGASPSAASATPSVLASPPPQGTSLYPILAHSYAGTIIDLLAKEQTAMYLTEVQQSQGSIRGFFQGLGLAGPFQGTLTPAGQLHFAVIIHAGEETLDFTGTIKIGGDIVGSFTVLDRNGNRTGESGAWNVSASG